jgi:hypothetical protein
MSLTRWPWPSALAAGALAQNVVAGRYVDDRFTVGERIEVDDWKG